MKTLMELGRLERPETEFLLGMIILEEFISMLFLTIVGGLGFLPGALLGAGFITGLDVWLSTFRSWSQLVFGVVVIAIMMLEPAGLYGRWLKIKRFWKSWPL